MVAGSGVAAFENHAGGLGHDLDTRNPAAPEVRSTDEPGVEGIGSGGAAKYFDYGGICINLTIKAEIGKRKEKIGKRIR